VRPDPRTARRTLRANAARLLGLPGVLFLAVGRKIRRGERRPVLAVRVFVRRKYGARGGRRIPRRLAAVGPGGERLSGFVPTDVEAAPRFPRALSLDGGTPIAGEMRGAVGIAFRTAAGRRLFVTNAHVVAGFDARAIGREVEADQRPARKVGVVHRTLPVRSGLRFLNRFDASVVRPTVPLRPYSVAGTPVVGPASLSVEREVGYFYVRRGVRKECEDPNELGTPLPVWKDGRIARFRDVFGLRLAGALAEPGDSGSLLVLDSPQGWKACGLVFAGRGGIVYAMPLAEALAALSGADASEGGDVEEDVRIAWP
jgi:hypothetical protein